MTLQISSAEKRLEKFVVQFKFQFLSYIVDSIVKVKELRNRVALPFLENVFFGRGIKVVSLFFFFKIFPPCNLSWSRRTSPCEKPIPQLRDNTVKFPFFVRNAFLLNV